MAQSSELLCEGLLRIRLVERFNMNIKVPAALAFLATLVLIGCSEQANTPPVETVTVVEEVTTKPAEGPTTQALEGTTVEQESTVQESYEDLAQELLLAYEGSIDVLKSSSELAQLMEENTDGQDSLTEEYEEIIDEASSVFQVDSHPILEQEIAVPPEYADCDNLILESKGEGTTAVEYLDDYLASRDQEDYIETIKRLAAAELTVSQAQTCFGFGTTEAESTSQEEVTNSEAEASGDPCENLPLGDYEVEQCESGTTDLDGTTESLSVMQADILTGEDIAIANEIASTIQEAYDLDIVIVDAEPLDPEEYGYVTPVPADGQAFSSLEVEEAYYDWEVSKIPTADEWCQENGGC